MWFVDMLQTFKRNKVTFIWYLTTEICFKNIESVARVCVDIENFFQFIKWQKLIWWMPFTYRENIQLCKNLFDFVRDQTVSKHSTVCRKLHVNSWLSEKNLFNFHVMEKVGEIIAALFFGHFIFFLNMPISDSKLKLFDLDKLTKIKYQLFLFKHLAMNANVRIEFILFWIKALIHFLRKNFSIFMKLKFFWEKLIFLL